jgi:hypothetical protein
MGDAVDLAYGQITFNQSGNLPKSSSVNSSDKRGYNPTRRPSPASLKLTSGSPRC